MTVEQLGRFRNDAARQRFLTAYDDALGAWPTPPSQCDVATQYGTTHVLVTGPSSGTPIILLHAVAVASPSWYPSIAALSEHHRVYAVDTMGDAGRSTQTARIRSGVDFSRWVLELSLIHI